MNELYYKEYYHLEREHWFFLARNNIILNHLSKITEKGKKYKVLNIGVATGRTSQLLEEFGKVKSVEFDEVCFNFTKNNVPDIDIIRGSILELPFEDESYDIVCAFDVIEHVEDDALAVKEMKRVCSKNGIVYVSVPAFNFLWSAHDDVNMHERRYTKKMLYNLFEDKHKILYFSYFNFWLFFPIAAYRVLSTVLGGRKKTEDTAGSDFDVAKGSFYQKVFYKIFNSENFFINNKIRLPVGVSALLSWTKSNV